MRFATVAAAVIVSLLVGGRLNGSDHADPMDLLRTQRQEGAITDLFCFPVYADDSPAFPFSRTSLLPLHNTLADIVRKPLTDDQIKSIDSLVIIMCMRRQLTDSTKLRFEPYTFTIHIDVDRTVLFPSESDLNEPAAPMNHTHSVTQSHTHHADDAALSVLEAFARYGGKIEEPHMISEDIKIEFQLTDNAELRAAPKYVGAAAAKWSSDSRVRPMAGVYDDPFIFPAFFGTNVVAFAIRIPLDLFPKGNTDFLLWGSSREGNTPIDHVGRSLRTQNPRFEILNKLHPSKHVKRLLDERDNPSLMRDVALRLNLASIYAYREWDFVPDVMCFSLRYPVGFPNGRLLTDDVAAILAQHGDTLLYELSFQDPKARWPRSETNDRSDDPNTPGVFKPKFPYLLSPLPDRPQPPPRSLTNASVVKLFTILIGLISFLVVSHLVFAKLYFRWQLRKRYL